ncbi:hypothetical protein TrRE_jg10072, partial [Triparma retinervis]
LAEMQVKNLDKFAKKLKKQYSDALSQNDEAIKEIKFIDGKLAYLKGKYKILTDNLAHRKTEYERMSKKLKECVDIQDNLMMDVKGRVQKNHHQMSQNQKKYARETKELARGFSNQPGSTCTLKEFQVRTRKLKKVAEERNAMVEKLRASGALGASLSDMKKLLANTKTSMNALSKSDSVKSMPGLKKKGNGGMRGSQSTSVL